MHPNMTKRSQACQVMWTLWTCSGVGVLRAVFFLGLREWRGKHSEQMFEHRKQGFHPHSRTIERDGHERCHGQVATHERYRYYACRLIGETGRCGTLLFSQSRGLTLEEKAHDIDSDPQQP